MTCPKCEGKTTVVRSLKDCESVHRKRRCLSCNHIFYTEEYESASEYHFKELESEWLKELRKEKQNENKA